MRGGGTEVPGRNGEFYSGKRRSKKIKQEEEEDDDGLIILSFDFGTRKIETVGPSNWTVIKSARKITTNTRVMSSF